jgi:hypothetical protein
MIKPASDLMAFNVPARGPTDLIAEEQGSVGRVVFVRYSRRGGIVLVVSYPHNGQTKCECVIYGVQWLRWYQHVVISTRQAALLVNRFFDDMGITP